MRKQLNKITATLLATAALTLAFLGCSSDGDDPPPQAQPSSSSQQKVLECLGLPEEPKNALTHIDHPAVLCNGEPVRIVEISILTGGNELNWQSPRAGTYDVSMIAESGICEGEEAYCGTLEVVPNVLTCSGWPAATRYAGNKVALPEVLCNGEPVLDEEFSTTPTTLTFQSPAAGTYEVSVLAESGLCDGEEASCGSLTISSIPYTPPPTPRPSSSSVASSSSSMTSSSSSLITYTLTTSVTPTAGGAVSRTPSTATYNEGTTVTVAAIANIGYKFVKWSGASTSTTSPVTITMNGDKTLTAEFVAITYGTSVSQTCNGKTQVYNTVTIGTQIWMAENLNCETAAGSKCYNDNSANCDKYGRLYNWNSAMNSSGSSTTNPSGVQGVCPDGWHLPSQAEWNALTSFINSDKSCSACAGTHLKAGIEWKSNDNGWDSYGFSALPGGNDRNGSNPVDVGSYGFWWSASEQNASNAYRMYMITGSSPSTTYWESYNKNSFNSVRCVKN